MFYVLILMLPVLVSDQCYGMELLFYPGGQFSEPRQKVAGVGKQLLSHKENAYHTHSIFEDITENCLTREDVRKTSELLSGNINVADVNGMTLLHYATMNGRRDQVEQLIAKGAPIMVADNQGYTPLHVAAMKGHSDIAELLLKSNADVMVESTAGAMPLHWAIIEGHEAVASLLLKAAKQKTLTSGRNAPIPTVDDFKVRDEAGYSPLHLAALKGHVSIAELLINEGSTIDTVDNFGATPLHVAARGEGYSPMVDFLLQRKANVMAADKDGATSLHFAAYSGHEKIVRLLLSTRRTCEPKRTSVYSIHLAMQKGHTKQRVVSLESNPAAVNAIDNESCTPLHEAAAIGHTECVAFLISKNARLDMAAVFGRMPMHYAYSSEKKKI